MVGLVLNKELISTVLANLDLLELSVMWRKFPVLWPLTGLVAVMFAPMVVLVKMTAMGFKVVTALWDFKAVTVGRILMNVPVVLANMEQSAETM